MDANKSQRLLTLMRFLEGKNHKQLTRGRGLQLQAIPLVNS